ncbi:hypothetical protein A6S26_32740 [Nostoc sp. ATCC 43529]|nr:hypothetical protein A6S26_32740 [Nostoc sp. ATCC 43529]
MASRQKAKQKFPDFIQIRQWLNFLKRYLIAGFLVGVSALKRLLRTISNHRTFFLVLVVILFFTLLTFAAIVPGTHRFEADIVAEKISFIYKGEENKLFLQNIRNIKELENEGKQILTFTGNFQSENLPELNKLDYLKIKLKDDKSRWIITPVNTKDTSEISLDKLRLQPNTKVTGLSYDFYRDELSFSLQPNSNLNPKIKPNKLDINLGNQPLKVILEGYELPDLKLPNQQDTPTILEFTLTPNNQVNLELTQKTSINITVEKIEEISKYKSKQWFRGEIKAENLQFLDVDRTGEDARDDLKISTIVEGKIRMVEQEKDIKQNQFLMGEDANSPLNIQEIRHLGIVPKKGIEARFFGKTKEIQIGLDPDFPVSRISGSWLDGVLPRDAIIALFSFGAATVANLLSWLFSNVSKSGSNP